MKTIITLLALSLMAPLAAQETDIALIVNKAIAVEKISAQDVRDIFTAKKRSWDDSTAVKIVIQSKNLPSFFEKFLGMSDSSFKKLWLKLTLEGKAKAPTDLTSDTEVLKYVAENSGAIGYVKAAALTDAVKRVSVTE
ncbi:MAG: hypothetical protein HZC28_16680 [Spirochaetes bacterium]|nr:hypothetical protein [Spirochaetota bacterium]